MYDSRLPLYFSVFALVFAVGVLVYKKFPFPEAHADTQVNAQPAPLSASPVSATPTSTSAIVPVGVAPFGQGRNNPVAFFVEPGARRVHACEYGTSGTPPRCSSSVY